MNCIEEEYLGLLSGVFHGAPPKNGRNGWTNSVFGRQLRHDMSLGFPLFQTKKLYFNHVVTELLWMIAGRTDMQYLHDHNLHYWDMNYEQSGRTDGTLGKVYGYQWNRDNQLQNVIAEAKAQPESRRLIVNAWNHADLQDAALPSCHYSWQLYINNGVVDLMWNQRSVDMFLGLPYDIALYALLLKMIAVELDLIPGQLICSLGDCHIYEVHRDAVQEQLSRTLSTDLPTVKTKGLMSTHEDITLNNYTPQAVIKAPLI